MKRFEALLQALHGAGVEYLIIGGVAGNLHGAARVTYDLDILYRRDAANVSRLVSALKPFSPYLRGAPPGLPFRWDDSTVLHGLNFTLTTTEGPIDLLGEVAGIGRYEDAITNCRRQQVLGLPVQYLSLRDLIMAKRAAGRPKDFESIAELEALLEEFGDTP